MAALCGAGIGRIPLEPADRVESNRLFGIVTEKDFAAGQKAAGAAAAKQLGFGVANNRPATAIGLGCQGKRSGDREIRNYDHPLLIFVTEGGYTQAITSFSKVTELEIALRITALLAKESEIGCEQGDSGSRDGVARGRITQLPCYRDGLAAQREGKGHERQSERRGLHVLTIT